MVFVAGQALFTRHVLELNLANRRHIQLLVPDMAMHGGIQSYMRRVWEMLNELPNTEIECMSLNDTDEALAHRLPDAAGRLRGFSRRKLSFVLQQLLQKQSKKIAVVGHLHLAPVALAAKMLGRIRGYIIILHGIEAWQRHRWLTRYAMRHSLKNVATTQYTADLNASLNGIPTEKYHVIPLCAERDISPSSRNFKLNGVFPLLMVARLDSSEKYKGTEMVIDVVAKLRHMGVPAHFNLVGDGDDRPRLQEYAGRRGSCEHVTFWGKLNDAELQAAYKSAFVFVMPSKKEGFGIVFLEAMRHGVPCIGGNHGGTPEVITDGINGYLVDWADVDTLESRLTLLWKNQATRAELGKAAFQAYHNKYSYPAFSLNWRKMINQIMANLS